MSAECAGALLVGVVVALAGAADVSVSGAAGLQRQPREGLFNTSTFNQTPFNGLSSVPEEQFLAGEAGVQCSATGALSVGKRMAGAASVGVDASATASVGKPLGGAAAVSAVAAGTLFCQEGKLLAGGAAAAASASGALAVGKALAGAAAVSVAGAGGLSVTSGPTGPVEAGASVSGGEAVASRVVPTVVVVSVDSAPQAAVTISEVIATRVT